MGAINVTGNKPESRALDSTQGLKSRGRHMHINHVTNPQCKRKNKDFNNDILQNIGKLVLYRYLCDSLFECELIINLDSKVHLNTESLHRWATEIFFYHCHLL